MLEIDPSFFTCRSWLAKILQRKSVGAEGLARELFRLRLVELGLGLLDERENVAHAENAPHDAVGMERFQGIVFLAHADELDGLPGHAANRQGRAAARIAIHLGQHHAGQRELLVELVGRAHCVLSGHGVGDEQNLLRVQDLLQRLHLVHQLLVDVQASCGIDDEHIARIDDGLAPRFFHQSLDVAVFDSSTLPSYSCA